MYKDYIFSLIILNSTMGKTDSSIVEQLLYKISRLKTAVNRQQYSDTYSI
jgi:hypothetical protein